MTSSIYPQPFTIAATPIAADTNILTSDIAITSDMVKPGGGGILRISFACDFSGGQTTMNIFNNDVFNGSLNPETKIVISDGYYIFDIGVESGDNINLQADTQVNIVRFIRAYLVLGGKGSLTQ